MFSDIRAGFPAPSLRVALAFHKLSVGLLSPFLFTTSSSPLRSTPTEIPLTTQPSLLRSPTKQTEPRWRPSRLPGFPKMHTKMEPKHTHRACLSRGRHTQDMQQPGMQIHCRMHVAGRCPCNARHARHAAGTQSPVAPAGPPSLARLLLFCCLGVFFSLISMFPCAAMPSGSPPARPAEAPHKPELNWQRKPAEIRRQGRSSGGRNR